MKMTEPYNKTIFILVLGMVLTGCGDSGEKAVDQPPPIPISLARAGGLEQAFHPVGSGEIKALDRANLGTRIMGQLERIHVDLGQKVEKGDPLVSINALDLRARMAQAEASIAQATAAYENAER